MQRRTLIILAVFIAGFGAGYGATWIVVGSPKSESAPKSATPTTQAPTNVAAARDAAVVVDNGADAGVAGASTARVGEADAGVAAAPDADEKDAGTAVAVAADASATGPGGGPDAAPEGEGKTPTSLCINAICRIDFGKVSGGLSVREGKLEDGQKVDWAKDFGKADKIGTIPHGTHSKPTRVEVKAIGMADGEPVAAWVVYKARKGKILEGVVALKLGDKSVSFVPEPDAKRDP